MAKGYSDMDENPRVDPPSIAVEVDRLIDEYSQQYQFYTRKREERRSESLVLFEENSHHSFASEFEPLYKMPSPDMERLERREENRNYHGMTADSIAVIRARRVVAYIRDSLGIPVLNASLPSDVESFLIGHPYYPIPLQGVNVRDEMGDDLWLGAEYRFYNRRVELRLGTAREFEERVREMLQRKDATERYQLRSTPTGER